MMRKVLLALTLVGMLGSVGACSAEPVSPTGPGVITTPNPAPVGAQRGSLVSQITMGRTDFAVMGLGAEAVRVVYRSTSGSGDTGTEVSGVVYIPRGDPPVDGWPIVSVAHGTTGVTDECAPSLYPNLLGTISMVAPFLERGMVVAVTDYEGIGTPGPHPYLDPDAAAHNVIDAVRAARNVVPSAGTRWGAIGNSQGGQAVWAAAERGDYGDGLDLVGSAALSPALNLSPMFDAGRALTLPQMLLTPFLVDGLQFERPEIADSVYIRGALAQEERALTACTELLGVQKAEAALLLTPADAAPESEEARLEMVDWLRAVALPRDRASAPLAVVVGEQDQLIDPSWTQEAVARACSMGDVVELRLEPDQGHSDQAAIEQGVEWLTDRFAGAPAPNTCEGTS